MKALILIAGTGSRLLPLTADKPQCLLELNSKTILKRMVQQLSSAGIKEIYLVVGHGKEKVHQEISNIQKTMDVKIIPIENPHYKTTSNIYSLWLAKNLLQEDFLLIDGDLVFDDTVLKSVLDAPLPSVIAVDSHRASSDEDVKVKVDSNGIIAIGKYVDPYKAFGISVGIHKFSQDAAQKLFQEVDALIHQGQHNVFYEEAIEKLIRKHRVDALVLKPEHNWEDVDYLDEYETVRHTFK